jgi:hypothetical protein
MKKIVLVFSIILTFVFNVHDYCYSQNVEFTFVGKTVMVMKNVDGELKFSESRNMDIEFGFNLNELKFSFKRDTLEENGNISSIGFLDEKGSTIDSDKFTKMVAKGKVPHYYFVTEEKDGRVFIFIMSYDFTSLKYFDTNFPDEAYFVIKSLTE